MNDRTHAFLNLALPLPLPSSLPAFHPGPSNRSLQIYRTTHQLNLLLRISRASEISLSLLLPLVHSFRFGGFLPITPYHDDGQETAHDGGSKKD